MLLAVLGCRGALALDEPRGGGQIEIQGEDRIVESHHPARTTREFFRRGGHK
jgi:hypothetical protein